MVVANSRTGEGGCCGRDLQDARQGARGRPRAGSQEPAARRGSPCGTAGRGWCPGTGPAAETVSACARSCCRTAALAPELHLVPGRDRRHLEQSAVPPARVDVRELAGLVLPGDLEPAVLDPVVEPGAAEDELPQPVDE